jgi:single-stranded DNA-binding protein
MTDGDDSTQMYVEADAKMDTYQAQDGTNRTALNLLQRKSKCCLV